MEKNPRENKGKELMLRIHWLEFPAAGMSFSSANRAEIPTFPALIRAEGSISDELIPLPMERGFPWERADLATVEQLQALQIPTGLHEEERRVLWTL